LLQLEKNYSQVNLNLVYFAEQLTKGRALSALQFTGKSTTWIRQHESWPVWAVKFAKQKASSCKLQATSEYNCIHNACSL
jgi:hypothetical protein